jgi:hypothetical protein
MNGQSRPTHPANLSRQTRSERVCTKRFVPAMVGLMLVSSGTAFVVTGCTGSQGGSRPGPTEPFGDTAGSPRPAGPDSLGQTTSNSSRFRIDEILTPSGQIEAVPGIITLVPVRVSGSLPSNGRIDVRTQAGEIVPASLLWLTAEQVDSYGWLPTARWSAHSAASATLPNTPGRWAVAIDLDQQQTQQSSGARPGFVLAGIRQGVRWTPSPESLLPLDSISSPGVWEPWTSPLPVDALQSARLRNMLQGLLADPLAAWRAELALGTLWSSHQQPAAQSTLSMEQRAIDGLTRSQRARWMSALAVLWSIDPLLASDVRATLTRCVQVSPGHWVPAWDPDPASADALVEGLLDGLHAAVGGSVPEFEQSVGASADQSVVQGSDSRMNEKKQALVRRWLSEQPAAVAWVEDTAGGATNNSEFVSTGATIGVAHLRPTDSLAWVETSTGPVVSEVAGYGLTRLTLPANASTQPMQAEQTVHCGSWEAVVRTPLARAQARPPGLGIAPFMPVWTCAQWLRGETITDLGEAGGMRTAGLLHRVAGPGGDRWTLLIECGVSGASPAAGDEVRVWVGAMGETGLVASLSPSAGVRTLVAGPAMQASQQVQAQGGVQTTGQTWRAELILPDALIPSDGQLLIGVARLNDGQVVTSWPWRMTPWQSEPGRAEVDLTRWDGLENASR